MIKEREIGGEKFFLVAAYWQKPNSWGHKCTLYRGHDFEIHETKIRYYNRTWERYTYQTVLIKCLEDYIKVIQKHALQNWKYIYNVKRMTGKKSEEFKAYYKEAQAGRLGEGLRAWIEELE